MIISVFHGANYVIRIAIVAIQIIAVMIFQRLLLFA